MSVTIGKINRNVLMEYSVMDGLEATVRLQKEIPWHSGVKLPDGHEVSCYNVDILIMLVRLLLSLGFVPEDGKRNYGAIIAACHSFGKSREDDYEAKGRFVTNLFPRESDHPKMLSKLTMHEIFERPEVKRFIFNNVSFVLVNRVEYTVDANCMEIRDASIVAHDLDSNNVYWDGASDLGEAVSRQAGAQAHDPDDPNLVRYRFSGRPKLIRVTYTPEADKAPGFEQTHGGSKTVNGNDTYALRVVVKATSPEGSGGRDEASNDIRIYAAVGEDIETNTVWDPEISYEEEKRNRRQVEPWNLGQKGYQYTLIYSSMIDPGADADAKALTPPPPSQTSREVRDTTPDHDFYHPQIYEDTLDGLSSEARRSPWRNMGTPTAEERGGFASPSGHGHTAGERSPWGLSPGEVPQGDQLRRVEPSRHGTEQASGSHEAYGRPILAGMSDRHGTRPGADYSSAIHHQPVYYAQDSRRSYNQDGRTNDGRDEGEQRREPPREPPQEPMADRLRGDASRRRGNNPHWRKYYLQQPYQQYRGGHR
ncbi:uncharacterized protein F4812DRAFT_468019 [Daldinia caldariorum]|uniref:uncharacterized protein n=1 Tax=Daldinia caldariorum TaxID=326644 RepID=UPI002008C43B|nr:uncharacterized protein F4812DRAFT_468019 [Daldinia caldariorum]KAI1464379.1 hypothetical protein F4812DRAFT_468019 [Daldinia caldariorum]